MIFQHRTVRIFQGYDQMKDKNKTQTHYMPIGMCLGYAIGTAIGVATDNRAMCMCLGISFGLCIGSLIDAQNRKKVKDTRKDEEAE